VYRGGRRLASSQFIIFFLPNGRGLSRFGISVKRVRPGRGGAVLRNRIRRRIREILRVHRQEIASGWDIVIHPRSSVATEQSRVLTTKLLEQLRSALGSGATKSE
jgi:ribonuclease P protein component